MHLATSRPRLMPLLREPERMNGTPNLVWVTGFPPRAGDAPQSSAPERHSAAAGSSGACSPS